MLRVYLLVALGGAVGSVLRVVTAQAMAARFGPAFPFGTLAVNLAGSFVIGVVATLLVPRLPAAKDVWALIVPGLLGGYTTFSAFEVETLALLRQGTPGRAVLYVGASVLLGLLVCWAGARLTAALTGR